MAPVEFPEDVWERIKAFRPRCSPTAMCIKRYMAAHILSCGDIILPIYGVCHKRMCGRRKCYVFLGPDGRIIRFVTCDYCNPYE